MIRILVADDHPVFREGLLTILDREADLAVVGQAASGREAIGLYNALRPDIALLDLSMPEIDGVEATQRICAADADARVVILTTFDGDQDIHQALRAGARAYVLKDAGLNELLHCIREVHAGKMYLPAQLATRLAAGFRTDPLTARELEVLRFVADGRSNRQIAVLLNVAEGTVKVHINNILTKLRAASRTEASAIARRRGLLSRR